MFKDKEIKSKTYFKNLLQFEMGWKKKTIEFYNWKGVYKLSSFSKDKRTDHLQF